MGETLSPQFLLQAYAQGIFPMAEGRDGPTHWYSANPRALLPLDERFHVRRSLAKALRRESLTITRDQAFAAVIHQCSLPRDHDGGQTWINQAIEVAFTELHRRGHAHSLEAWDASGHLAGGIYGVSLGAAFFGESMFSRRPWASQICLVHLVEHLRSRGYVLFDVQFTNPHLQQFGVFEIDHAEYLPQLRAAIAMDVTWQ